jgi:hypothetical protein
MHTTKRGEPLPINQALNRPRAKLSLDLTAWMAIVFVTVTAQEQYRPLLAEAAVARHPQSAQDRQRGEHVRRDRRHEHRAQYELAQHIDHGLECVGSFDER